MATAADATLILELYKLRTEETMRKARAFLSAFEPATAEDFLALQRARGTEENAFYRQVTSYWEMAAAFVLNDALDGDLFAETTGEPFFYYAKFTPFLDAHLAANGQPFMAKTAKLIELYPPMQKRYTMMLAQIEARRKQQQVS